jgi:hypothetical protein
MPRETETLAVVRDSLNRERFRIRSMHLKRLSFQFCAAVALVLAGCEPPATIGVTAEISVTCPASTPTSAKVQCTTIDFGVVPVGDVSEQQLLVTDTGRAKLIVSSTTVSPAGSPFTLLSSVTSLVQNGQSTVSVSFAPTSLGSTSAVLTIKSNSATKPDVQITLTGTGVGPAKASLMPTTLNFGNVLMGTTATLTAALTNNDVVTLDIVQVNLTSGGPTFGASAGSLTTVATGESGAITATFSPTAPGTFTGAAAVQVRRADVPEANPTTLTLQLVGESLPVMQVAPTALTFTNDTLGSMGTQSFTISNIGKAPLTLSSVALTSSSSTTFSLPAMTPAVSTLAPTAMTTVTVTYAPVLTMSTGPDTGSVTVAGSDPASPTATVTLNAQCTNCTMPPNPCVTSRTCTCGVQTTCGTGGSCVPARRVFVTNAPQTNGADFGGLAGADAFCNMAATTAQLGGTWMAFLADDAGAPASRFTLASVPYALLDGTVIASNGTELLSGSIENPIDLDECAQQITNAEVWTGLETPSDSPGEGAWCADFTSNDVNATYSPVGLTSQTGSGWVNVYVQFCNRTNVRLYCFEQ